MSFTIWTSKDQAYSVAVSAPIISSYGLTSVRVDDFIFLVYYLYHRAALEKKNKLSQKLLSFISPGRLCIADVCAFIVSGPFVILLTLAHQPFSFCLCRLRCFQVSGFFANPVHSKQPSLAWFQFH